MPSNTHVADLTMPEMVREYLAWVWGKRRVQTFWREWWPPVLFAVLLGIAAIVLAVWVVTNAISKIVEAVTDWAAGGSEWGHGKAVWAILENPVSGFLATHSAGLPLSQQTLWWTWATAGVTLFLLSTTRVRAGRVGWVLFGAATAAMVWDGTENQTRPVATGLVVLAWLALSVPAMRRSPTGPPAILIPAPPAAPNASPAPTP